MERTESDAKVFCGYGGVADQRMPASWRAEVVWPNGLKGPGVYTGRLGGLLPWMVPGEVQLGTKQLDFPGLGD